MPFFRKRLVTKVFFSSQTVLYLLAILFLIYSILLQKMMGDAYAYRGIRTKTEYYIVSLSIILITFVISYFVDKYRTLDKSIRIEKDGLYVDGAKKLFIAREAITKIIYRDSRTRWSTSYSVIFCLTSGKQYSYEELLENELIAFLSDLCAAGFVAPAFIKPRNTTHYQKFFRNVILCFIFGIFAISLVLGLGLYMFKIV